MLVLYPGSSFAILLYLSQLSNAQGQETFTNDTIPWKGSPSLIFSKRTTCSGTCAECYGKGSIYCGTDDACYNPTIGESCCAEYSYSCSDGYYCAPGGLDMECCANGVSTSECVTSINNGGGTSGGGSSSGGGGSGGLSAGAKAGIGIGVALLLLIIIGVVAFFFFRQRSRKRNKEPAPAAWQMPQLAGGPGGPGLAQPSYNGPQGGYDNAQSSYNGALGGYNGAQGGYDNRQGGYVGGYGNPDTKGQSYYGGPPVADVYTPGNGPQKPGYNGYVPSHTELPETQPMHVASPAMSHTYPAPSEQDRAGAAELYGGHMGQNY